MLARLLCRFRWYRRLVGGEWTPAGGSWSRLQLIDPLDFGAFFTDDTSLRHDIQEHLKHCEKEGQRERT